MCDSDEDGYEATDAATIDQDMRENILKYFDRTGHLEKLQTDGLRFKQKLVVEIDGRKDMDLSSFTSTVNLDLSLIADISGKLSLLILEEPDRAHRLFRDVVHCSLVTLCCLPAVRTDQVQVVLRVRSLLAEEALTTEGLPRPDPTSRRLLLLQGVVVSITTPTKYTRSAVFRCPGADCPGATGLRIWGPTAPRRRCRFCGGVAEETPRGRDVGEQMLAVLVRPSALRASRAGEAVVSHPIVVRFADDLAGLDVLQLGARYDVLILTAAGPGAVAEAWGVRPWQDGALRRVVRGLRSDPLPESIQSVWLQSSADRESPWAFAVSLAAQLGGGLYPAHTFLHLKLGILLSLASQGLHHPPVALLAVGADPAGPALLSRCALLADRVLSVATTADFSKLSPASAARAEARAHASAGAWLSGGPLVLARGGVCLLGCWDKWNRSSSALSITSALESGKVILESRDLAGAQLPSAGPSVPLQCAVWAYWSPRSKTRMAEVLTLRTLLNTLGAPVLADSCCDSEVEDVCLHLLLKATGAPDMENMVLESEMVEFLRLVNAQPVALTDEASRLIQDYFVASRRARPNCLPVTAVGTMACMAEALARLSLRMEATWADVVLVVWMYETAFNALFGPCLISPLPDCCTQRLNAEHFIEQMDCRLDSMKVWLENFTKSVLLSSLRV